MSAFQVHISDHDILTPGDHPDVLVAMNPAALRANVKDLAPAGTIIVNSDAFDDRALAKAGYAEPTRWTDGSLKDFKVYEIPMTSITLEAVKPSGTRPSRRRALEEPLRPRGHVLDVHPPVEATIAWIEEKFARNDDGQDQANILAFKAGLQLRRDRRAVRVQLHRQAGGARARAPTPTSRATRPWRGG